MNLIKLITFHYLELKLTWKFEFQRMYCYLYSQILYFSLFRRVSHKMKKNICLRFIMMEQFKLFNSIRMKAILLLFYIIINCY